MQISNYMKQIFGKKEEGKKINILLNFFYSLIL